MEQCPRCHAHMFCQPRWICGETRFIWECHVCGWDSTQEKTVTDIFVGSKVKPSVFEISVDEQDFDKAKAEVNEVRLTKSFLNECLETAERLRKNKCR